MRSVELQFIDKLEVIKQQLIAQKQSNQNSIVSPKEGVLALIKDRIQIENKLLQTEDLLTQSVLKIMHDLIKLLIAKAKNNEIFNSKNIAVLIDSLLTDNSPKILKTMAFSGLIEHIGCYKAIEEKICQQYELDIPESKAHIVVDLSDLNYVDLQFEDDPFYGMVSLFALEEMDYMWDYTHNTNKILDGLSKSSDLPYLRHIKSDDLTLRLIAAIKETQQNIHSVIIRGKYSDKVINSAAIAPKLKQLSNDLTHSIDWLENKEKELRKFAGDGQWIAITREKAKYLRQKTEGSFYYYRTLKEEVSNLSKNIAKIESIEKAFIGKVQQIDGVSTQQINALGLGDFVREEAVNVNNLNSFIQSVYRENFTSLSQRYHALYNNFFAKLENKPNALVGIPPYNKFTTSSLGMFQSPQRNENPSRDNFNCKANTSP